MDKAETSLMQKTPSKHVSDAGNVSKKVLPFYFVKIWPKDSHPKYRVLEAIGLSKENGGQQFQISEKIRENEFEREREVSRLEDLKYYHDWLNWKVESKVKVPKNLNLQQDNLCFANEAHRRRTTESACTEDDDVDGHKLNFWMLHRSKKLSKEKKILREMNSRQQRDAVSTLPSDAHYEELKYSKDAQRNSISSMKNLTKAVCDELMEMRKEKKTLEARIKNAERRLEAIKRETWCCSMKNLKDEQQRKEVSVRILEERKIYDDECWVLQFRNMESMHRHSCTIYMEKCSSRWRAMCIH